MILPMLKSDVIYDAVRSRILAGALQPGERLVVREIAQEHGVSDIPVREALQRLQQDGLVDLTPYRGARVVEVSPEEVREAYLIRGHLESLATVEALDHLTDVHFAALDELLETMAEAVQAGDTVRYADLNRQFHGVIFEACPHRKLIALITGLWDGQQGYRTVFYMSPTHMQRSLQEHREIVALLRDGSHDEVAALARDHKLNVYESLVASMPAAGTAVKAAQ